MKNNLLSFFELGDFFFTAMALIKKAGRVRERKKPERTERPGNVGQRHNILIQ